MSECSRGPAFNRVDRDRVNLEADGGFRDELSHDSAIAAAVMIREESLDKVLCHDNRVTV